MDTSIQTSTFRSQLEYRSRRLKETLQELPSKPAQLVTLLQEVESALERIDDGSYGICWVCEGQIESDYLRAFPLATVCLEHLSDEQQRAIERDLQLASRIQAQLLPPTDLKLPGYEFAYRYEPVGPVSGDYCDVVKRENGTVYIFIGDVTGKGVSASLLMTQLHAIFHSLISDGISPAQLVERANHVFSETALTTHFATLVCGRLEEDGTVEFANAGHNPPLLLRSSGDHAQIRPTGFPIGIAKDGHYEMERFRLQRNDMLFLYTDGLTESRNTVEEEFGEERLVSLLAGHKHLAPRQLIDLCREKFALFCNGRERMDDLTILALKRTI